MGTVTCHCKVDGTNVGKLVTVTQVGFPEPTICWSTQFVEGTTHEIAIRPLATSGKATGKRESDRPSQTCPLALSAETDTSRWPSAEEATARHGKAGAVFMFHETPELVDV